MKVDWQAVAQIYSAQLQEIRAERDGLREALVAFRSLVKEGGVPRYTVTPGAALNSVIEERVDPALATSAHPSPLGKGEA